jgi:hypothetical protein
MDPGGSAEEIDKVFLKTCLVDLLFTWMRVWRLSTLLS